MNDLDFLERAIRFQDGAAAPDEAAAFQDELRSDPDKLRAFAELQMQAALVREVARREAYQHAERPAIPIRCFRHAIPLATAAGLLLATLLGVAALRRLERRTEGHAEAARLAGASRARFLGQPVPDVGAALERGRDYVLTDGLVELAFPAGASAVLEAPASFRVEAADVLALEIGRCSVHAPGNAAGFRVETPATRVIDRGTRFVVNVRETNETEVQVVEGAADVYRRPDGEAEPALQARLVENQARRFASADVDGASAMGFRPEMYRPRLPDRVVSYKAEPRSDGGVGRLRSVTVQRGGENRTYPIERLIPVGLTWFRPDPGRDPNGHLASGPDLILPRRNLLSDDALDTGVINPGGSREPLRSAPVLDSSADGDGTPGMAVHFREPVVNGPGPDVVVFEIQCLTNSLDGDAFHVAPLSFQGGRRSHTIRAWDLTMNSPEALRTSGFHLYRSPEPVLDLEGLERSPLITTRIRSGFRNLAVGIDLSDLGFAEGESVQDLFLQDAADDDQRVDPVLISGLPNGVPE